MIINFLRNKIRLSSKHRQEPYLFWYGLLGFWPNQVDIYGQAMRHSSAAKSTGLPHNERLEYVGDALLSAIVGELLYVRYPAKSEGELTKLRSRLVKRQTLNALARTIGLDKRIERSVHVAEYSEDINGNAFEALVGAVYFDQGFAVCRRFIERMFFENPSLAKCMEQTDDYKSDLLQWAQRKHKQVAFELLADELVVPNGHVFRVRLCVNGAEMAQAAGSTKRQAEQVASKKTIALLKKKVEW